MVRVVSSPNTCDMSGDSVEKLNFKSNENTLL